MALKKTALVKRDEGGYAFWQNLEKYEILFQSLVLLTSSGSMSKRQEKKSGL